MQEIFDEAAASLGAQDPRLSRGRIFNHPGLRVGRHFAGFVRGENLVVKLPADLVRALVEAGLGTRYDRGDGRPLKEWVSLQPPDAQAAETYLRDAIVFVADTGTGPSA